MALDDAGGPSLVSRAYRGEADYWRIRRLLVETYPGTPFAMNWEVRRWDGWFWHHADRGWLRRGPQDGVRLWETTDGHLAAAVLSEDGGGDAHLQVRPEFRHLEPELLTWAEDHLSAPDEGEPGNRFLTVTVFDHDHDRVELVRRRGYQAAWPVTARQMLLDPQAEPPASPEPVDGYRIRAIRPADERDYQRLADILNAGFGCDNHTAADQMALTPAPCYRADLQLVAETRDGSFAAHAAFNVDAENRRAVLEPVCTHPEHRRRGLAAALIAEGIHRVVRDGARDLCVEAFDLGPNDLYRRAGFTRSYPGSIYRRALSG